MPQPRCHVKLCIVSSVLLQASEHAAWLVTMRQVESCTCPSKHPLAGTLQKDRGASGLCERFMLGIVPNTCRIPLACLSASRTLIPVLRHQHLINRCMASQDYSQAPPDLPRPEDDGACAHLTQHAVPSLSLQATNGQSVDLAGLTGSTVVFCYPMTGRPGVPLPDGWDSIPGARGKMLLQCHTNTVWR